jgi:acyl-CoA synthetase (AMP-forming)/AMP-acid ligase II
MFKSTADSLAKERHMLIQNFLENSAETYPNKCAVWHNNNSITYLQLDQKANKIANFLIENGINRGDRIALLIDNSIEYIISYFGILKAGAVVIALNNEIKPANLHYYLNNSDASAIITVNHFMSIINGLPDLCLVKFIITDQAEMIYPKINLYFFQEILENGNTSKPSIKSISIDMAAIVYTSGSTGEPKGVMLSHQNLFDNTKSIVQYLHLTVEDSIMVVLPFYYIYGKSLLLTHFCVGGSIIIENRFVFPNVVIDTMKKFKVSGFAGVPSTYTLLLNNSAIRNSKIDSLRYITQAGGAMAPTVQREVADVFSPAKLYIMYGTTEASPRLTYLEPEMLQSKYGSIGKAIPNVEIIIADEFGKPVANNQTGEIVARGSNIMMGYWKDPESTVAVLRNGLYYTGDIGKSDDDGYIYVVGRKSDMIKVGGNRVSAKEIEEALVSLPEISEVAAIGVPDTILGEAIKAFIVLKSDSTIDISTIRQKLYPLLPSYKIPKYFEFKENLPKNGSGKIMKEILRNLI